MRWYCTYNEERVKLTKVTERVKLTKVTERVKLTKVTVLQNCLFIKCVTSSK